MVGRSQPHWKNIGPRDMAGSPGCVPRPCGVTTEPMDVVDLLKLPYIHYDEFKVCKCIPVQIRPGFQPYGYDLLASH